MANVDVQRAWRDGEYYLSLTDEQRSLLPDGPVGMIAMGEGEVAGFGDLCTNTHQSWCYNSACATRCSCIC